MKKGLALILATSLTGFAAPAYAQDPGFTGPWIAGVGGYDVNKTGSTEDDDIQEDVDESIEGVLYGAAIGYDYDFGNVVVGAEAELTGSTADYEEDAQFGLGDVDAGRDIYVGARLGFEARPGTLIYAKGGYTNARYNFVNAEGVTDYDINLDTDGYRVGGGVEQRFGVGSGPGNPFGNAFARLEYRYSNYPDAEFDYEVDVPDSGRFEIDTDRHQVVAAVGLRF